ncbi:NUDIX domain-containing protein [Vannielia litorea]|uniref:NUDIX domain-containing protein n=1 Tax=Vannielia litorea TaxID=1217970 RepID=UPI001C93DB2D|nr:gamma-glutamylcyclotransferase [Vannielia litorea]MBY6047627.1 gamma-glutamylcyclotransferase [Vannielia litorea]MBY6075041.1 gamma-glutamylcyclotransferase [Vannielia litorea]
MADIFIYGTLMHEPLLRVVLGAGFDVVEQVAARLPGWRVEAVPGEVYPMVRADAEAEAHGLLLRGLTDEALARADFYEGLDNYGYLRKPVMVQTEDGPAEATVYVPLSQDGVSAGDWSLAAWAEKWGELSTLAAEEVMWWMGRATTAEVGRRYGVICTRAQARLNAREEAPTTLRRRAREGDVRVNALRRPYAGFFAVEELELSHIRFDGGDGGPIQRAAFVSADAATVLPYDPKRDRVMLVEQMRPGPLARGDAQPWVLEPIAGRVDPGESPEECAHREAMEEAGLVLERLISTGGYYPSPGAKTEYLYGFIGLADLHDDAAGLGGVAGEGEDIRAHLVSFDAAMGLLESGEINVGTTVASLLHLAARRDGLRGQS